MKCIDRYVKMTAGILLSGMLLVGCTKQEELIVPYETGTYNQSLYTGTLFADNLCVSKEDKNNLQVAEDTSLHAAGLFDLNNKEVLYAYRIHDKLFPASTTKVMTALVALKYGTLSDVVDVSARATTELDKESSVAGLIEGDKLTLEDLLYGLMLESGNDAAVAIAEHVSGSVEAFVELMNQEAKEIGATNSHFTNPHGLQDKDHYTTAYDLYLTFNQAMQDNRFLDITKSTSYKPSITDAAGNKRPNIEWKPTNNYATGKAQFPGNSIMLGGKTGTTNEAGACLIFLTEDKSGNPYISIVMGASDKPTLYTDMTAIISKIPNP